MVRRPSFKLAYFALELIQDHLPFLYLSPTVMLGVPQQSSLAQPARIPDALQKLLRAPAPPSSPNQRPPMMGAPPAILPEVHCCPTLDTSSHHLHHKYHLEVHCMHVSVRNVCFSNSTVYLVEVYRHDVYCFKMCMPTSN